MVWERDYIQRGRPQRYVDCPGLWILHCEPPNRLVTSHDDDEEEALVFMDVVFHRFTRQAVFVEGELSDEPFTAVLRPALWPKLKGIDIHVGK